MNIAMRKLLPSFVFIGLSLSGCGSDDASEVRQEKIYQFYEVRYDAAAEATTYQAIFRKESAVGHALQLDEGMSVSVNGITMRREHRDTDNSENENNVYETKVKGSPGNDTMFVWQDANGRKFTNTVSFVDFEEPSVPTTLSRSVESHLDWLGAKHPEAYEDTAVATIRSLRSGQTVFASVNIAKGDKLFTFPLKETQRLATGKGDLRIERKTHVALQESTQSGGVMRVVTVGEVHELEIVD